MYKTSTLVGALTALTLCLGPAVAFAQYVPLGPEPALVFEGRVGYATNADTLLECDSVACGRQAEELGIDPALLGLNGRNCTGVERSTIDIEGVPVGARTRILHARLNWAASAPWRTAPDNQVSLTGPDGEPIVVDADPALSVSHDDPLDDASCQALALTCGIQNPGCGVTVYSNFADVTEQVRAHREAGNPLNGDWTLTDISVSGAQDNDRNTVVAAAASLTIGAWSLVIVFEDPETLPERRVYYYQGFELNEGRPRNLFPEGFLAPPDPTLDMTIMVLEGDEGITGDSLSVNGRQISDACNPRTNVFNSTVNIGGECRRGVTGVDLDRFSVENAIRAGDEEAEIEIDIPGEQLFTNWLILAFDHMLPDFQRFKPEKEAVPRSGSIVRPGEVISYRITIGNDGDVAATNVVLTDPVPLFTEYIPGSAQLDGAGFRDDPGGASPLANGLELTQIPQVGNTIEVGEEHQFSFEVRVLPDAPHGYIIRNTATIAADLIEPQDTDEVVHTVVASDADIPPPPVPDAMPPSPDLDAGLAPDFLMPVDPDEPDAERDRGGALTFDARPPEPDGAVNPCGPGTQLGENGTCVSICGDGLRWDPTCGTEGQCVQAAQPPCQSSGSADAGCACDVQDGGPGGALFLMALLGLLRRRRVGA